MKLFVSSASMCVTIGISKIEYEIKYLPIHVDV